MPISSPRGRKAVASRFWLIAALLSPLLCCGKVVAQTDGPLQILDVQPSPGGWQLTWQQTATGKAYTVTFQDTLEDGIWRMAQSPILFPVTSQNWLDLSVTNASRYYRVVAVPVAQRGRLISAAYNRTMSTFSLSLLFSLGGVPITPQYSVRMYKMTYETISPWGAQTIATGALLLPESTGHLLPLTSYQHGTMTQTNAAPSFLDVTGEVGVGLALATTGYAVSMPDYLGLGSSPGFHPFHHARSEATASVDMLRAVRTFCATNGFGLTNKLFLAGYSQGGHATMALCRELETYHTNEFAITACAPMAGAYDLSGVTTSNFLASAPTPNPYYMLYLLAAYQDVYHLGASLGDLLAPPYNATLPPLIYSGTNSSAQLNAAMPSDPVQVMRADYLAAFRSNPRHPLRLALADNDLYRWRPLSPMQMYHCAADQDVIIANSFVALASFQQQGATQVQFFDPNASYDHSSCAEPSFLAVKAWFDSLR